MEEYIEELTEIEALLNEQFESDEEWGDDFSEI